MPKKRTKITKTKRKTRTKRQPVERVLVPEDRDRVYPIQTAPAASREDQLRNWFDFQFNQLRDRIDRLETSSVGEFATLIDSLRQQVRDIERGELARVTEINRIGRSAVDAARGRVEDVVTKASQEFVSHSYLHSWVARMNEQLDEIRALVNKLAPATTE